jgi:hypothetical protein
LAIALLCGCAAAPTIVAVPGQPLSQIAQRTSVASGSYVYAGTFTQVDSRGKRRATPVSERISDGPATVRGIVTTAYHGVENEGGQGDGATFDADIAAIASTIRSGSNVQLVRMKTSSGGIAETTNYEMGNGVFDQLPEIPQARWTNTAARTQSIVDSVNSSSLIDTYRPDGSYDETAIPVEGEHAILQSYADGNAVYQWPFDGGALASTIAFSPPRDGKLQIILVNGAYKATEKIVFLDWYPSLSTLSSDAFVDAGATNVPSACGVAKRFAAGANEIEELTTRLDIVFGQYETIRRDAYVGAKYGLVCLAVHDELSTYYGYEELAFSSKPLMKTDSDEILGLRSASAPSGSVSPAPAALPLDALTAAARDARRIETARDIFASRSRIRAHA